MGCEKLSLKYKVLPLREGLSLKKIKTMHESELGEINRRVNAREERLPPAKGVKKRVSYQELNLEKL